MSGLRGFGMVTQVNGPARYWYAGQDGVRRWSDTREQVDGEAQFIAAMQRGIPPIQRPDALDVIDMNNHAINEIRDSAERAEETGELPRMDYGRLSRKEIEEGNQAADRG